MLTVFTYELPSLGYKVFPRNTFGAKRENGYNFRYVDMFWEVNLIESEMRFGSRRNILYIYNGVCVCVK